MNNCIFEILSDSEKKWCEKNKVKTTYPGCVDYPAAFMDMPYRPASLFYIGEPVWLSHPLLSVVGSRSPQVSSLNWLDDVLSEFLLKYPFAIVSGGARGIDQKAHQLALRTERPTVVFSPSGLMNLYPEQLGEWVAPICAAGGCIVSQFLPAHRMQKRYFRERNRLIAALSPMTLIIECKRRSGTMLTANYALDYQKRLGVMPTFPGEAGMGGLDLICDSVATIIRDVTDLELAVLQATKLHYAEYKKYNISQPSPD